MCALVLGTVCGFNNFESVFYLYTNVNHILNVLIFSKCQVELIYF